MLMILAQCQSVALCVPQQEILICGKRHEDINGTSVYLGGEHLQTTATSQLHNPGEGPYWFDFCHIVMQ
jgi:hypothetical protein